MRYFFAILSLIVAAAMLILGVGQRTFLAGPKAIEEEVAVATQSDSFLILEHDVFSKNKGNPSVIVNGADVFLALGSTRDVAAWVEPFNHSVVSLDPDVAQLEVTSVPAVLQEGAADSTDEESSEEAAEPAEDSEEATAEEPDVFFEPRGSDLWLAEHSGETTLKVAVSPAKNQSVIITSGAESFVHPKDVIIMWAQPRVTPWAGPLLAGGLALAVVGVILYLMAVDHDRRGLGPRRGRTGIFQGLRNRRAKLEIPVEKQPKTGTRRGSRLGMSVALVGVSTVLLTSCSPSYWPDFSQSQPPVVENNQDDSLAVVPVTDAQLEAIVEDVSSVSIEADSELDSTVLESRFTGPALAQRKSNYLIKKEEPAWAELPHITSDRLSYDLVQSTEKWPRTVFVTVSSEADLNTLLGVEEPEEDPEGDDSNAEAETGEEAPAPVVAPTLALVLKQDSPHDNFKVHNVIELRGGIDMPEAAPASEGTAVLADNIETLKLTPRLAVEYLAKIMQGGVDYEEEIPVPEDETAPELEGAIGESAGELSAEDPQEAVEPDTFRPADFFNLTNEILVEKMGLAWVTNQCSEGISCSSQVVVSEEPIISFSTGQSGVLVLATILDRHVMEAKSSREIVQLSKVERALGLDGNYERVVREWQHQVLLYVPGADSEKKISVLGSSSELVRVTGKKAEI